MGKRQRRRSRLKQGCGQGSSNSQALRAPIDGVVAAWVSPDCPAQVAEQFWRQVQAFEQEGDTVLFERLEASGMTLPAADQLDDAQLGAKLWEVIGALATLGVYLHSTDHLSDRQLYAYLWTDALRTPATILPDDFTFAYHIDVIGSGSDEDLALFLQYYADDDARDLWADQLSDVPVPNRQPPPFQRDHRLPRPRNQPEADD